MEADSTTCDKSITDLRNEPHLPFSTTPCNFNLYKAFITVNGDKQLKLQIIEKLQEFGLIPETISCPSNKPECVVVKKSARVIDGVQWSCEECGKKQPIRAHSFFFRIQCSILQTLQITLAWCEDADLAVAAEFFVARHSDYRVPDGVKLNVGILLYDRLDDLAIREYNKDLLGGEDNVVLAEVYPDCVNRLSPDTTDQPHVHRILMLADTRHIPTRYRLSVIKDHKKEMELDNKTLKLEVEQIIQNSTLPNSMVVTGNSLPSIDGTSSLQHLTQFCDVSTQRFLTSRIWSQAITLCGASRDLCGHSRLQSATCANAVQRYLDTALYRLRYDDGFYDHMLKVVADEFNRGEF